MKIKDVEEQVGISVHSIRFYEEVGLIRINRMKDSKYRDFTMSDIEKLKEIKLLRSLGVTIEEIRRYYKNEISLEEMMNHQKLELKAQDADMQMKLKLCEDIQKGKTPLIPYLVDQYEGVMQHKSEHLPYENCGSLLAKWGQSNISRKRLILLECVLFPILWLMSTNVLLYLFMIPEMLGLSPIPYGYDIAVICAFFIATIMAYLDYLLHMKAPGELYEFCEKGIYYVNQDTKRSFRELHKAIRSGNIQNSYDFLPYEQIAVFKVWYRVVGRAPVNGANAYQMDFRIFSEQDEMIRMDTGVIGTSDETVRLTAEILKRYAKKIIDPFHLLDHLDDDRESFYAFIDELHRKREHKRVGIIDKV